MSQQGAGCGGGGDETDDQISHLVDEARFQRERADSAFRLLDEERAAHAKTVEKLEWRIRALEKENNGRRDAMARLVWDGAPPPCLTEPPLPTSSSSSPDDADGRRIHPQHSHAAWQQDMEAHMNDWGSDSDGEVEAAGGEAAAAAATASTAAPTTTTTTTTTT
eukprot:Rhum_TRINITY_DN14746_c6_g1::Rhum_TRINITY_DN14746_c6_g1_i1::g.115195::m.115195